MASSSSRVAAGAAALLRRTFRSILDDHIKGFTLLVITYAANRVFDSWKASNANNQILATAQPTNEVNDLRTKLRWMLTFVVILTCYSLSTTIFIATTLEEADDFDFRPHPRKASGAAHAAIGSPFAGHMSANDGLETVGHQVFRWVDSNKFNALLIAGSIVALDFSNAFVYLDRLDITWKALSIPLRFLSRVLSPLLHAIGRGASGMLVALARARALGKT
jgi:hypothetical protein